MKWLTVLSCLVVAPAFADFDPIQSAATATKVLDRKGFAIICIPPNWAPNPERAAANLNAVLDAIEANVTLSDLTLNADAVLCVIAHKVP